MQTILVNDVVVPDNRQRREFDEDALKELADSIESDIGLMQPLVLRSDHKTLVAGERRLRAVRMLYEAGKDFTHDATPVPEGHVPYVVLDDLPADQVHEAELHENAIRIDLSWQERARAMAELHRFRVKQHGEYDRATGEGQTLKATASEILGKEARGSQISDVSDAMLLTDFLDDPFVAAAPDVRTAKKRIREEIKHRERTELASGFDHSGSQHTLILGDSLEVSLPAGAFQVIVTDPPYGIEAHETDTFDDDKHEYDDSYDAFQKIARWLPFRSYELAAPDAHLYCFCDIRRFDELLAEFELAGWNVWTRPIIWDKGNTGSYGNIEYGPRACYESILYARKGDRKANAGYRDVINITQKTNSKHPAGKPWELYAELIKRSALPGDNVLDLFAGSGPIFLAAQDQRVYATGVELNPKYHAMCVEQLAAIKDGPKRDEVPF